MTIPPNIDVNARAISVAEGFLLAFLFSCVSAGIKIAKAATLLTILERAAEIEIL